MSAQATPIITGPLPMLPVPIERWRPGQKLGDFLAELRRDYVLMLTCDGPRMVRKQ